MYTMKKFNFISRKLVFLSLLVVTSCEGILILDPIDPRLPKYTETGNNVAGAIINQEIWRSVVSHGFLSESGAPHIAAHTNGDSLVIRFEGELGSQRPVYFEFHLKNLNIEKFEDLSLLNNKKITIDGTSNDVLLFDENRECIAKGVGQLYFKHVNLNHSIFIISGTFGFVVENSCKEKN